MNNSRLKINILILAAILIITALLGITKGSVNIPVFELFTQENRPILNLRLLRILVAIIAGSGLAVAGIALQAILRNPLAEPYLLGTSSGAGLGAILAIIIGLNKLYFPAAAFIGAIITIILVYYLAKEGNKIPVQSLILSGVIISIALSGIIVFLISISGNDALYGVTWWLWGSMQPYDLSLLSIASLIVVAGIIAIYVLWQDLNAISIGEEEAMHLGVNAEGIKKLVFIITALITASLVSICGIIGFVGLIVPHALRLVVGPNHRILIPAGCLAAASFMIICDLISRVAFNPIEIPIGVVTAVIGVPIFVILLKNKQKIK